MNRISLLRTASRLEAAVLRIGGSAGRAVAGVRKELALFYLFVELGW